MGIHQSLDIPDAVERCGVHPETLLEKPTEVEHSMIGVKHSTSSYLNHTVNNLGFTEACSLKCGLYL
jgi:hypothetical protein